MEALAQNSCSWNIYTHLYTIHNTHTHIYTHIHTYIYSYTNVYMYIHIHLGFPGSSAAEESACNAGDSSSIPGSWRLAGEGIGYPLQYSWASLLAQTVKNLPAMWETWVRKIWVPSLGWEDPLEEGMQPTPVFLSGESPWTEEPGGQQSMGSQRVRYLAQHSTCTLRHKYTQVHVGMDTWTCCTRVHILTHIHLCTLMHTHTIYTHTHALMTHILHYNINT